MKLRLVGLGLALIVGAGAQDANPTGPILHNKIFYFFDNTGASITLPVSAVPGAPYAATVTVETVQRLADGNEIEHKSSFKVFRDGHGRTRRENLDGSGAVQSVVVSDPAAGTQYELLAGSHTAVGGYSVSTATGGYTVRGNSLEAYYTSPDTSGESGTTISETLAPTLYEGLNVTGKRTTRTIPAGQIGNKLPLVVVTEQWYSPDLEIYVLTKHSDPQAGTTTTSYTHIKRAEPDASLFQIPAGYTVTGDKKPGGGQ